MIEFNKPTDLDGNVLEAELIKVGVTLPERSIYVVGDKVFLPITEEQKATVQSVIDTL